MNRIMYVGEHPKIYNVRMHKHDHWEIVYCTAGQGTFRFEKQPAITYTAGETVVIPPQMAHANSSTEGFANIHIMLDSPSFPYREAFRVVDEEGGLANAFAQVRLYHIFTDGAAQSRDSSAAAIAVCGMLEMGKYLPELHPEKKTYQMACHRILRSLIQNYQGTQVAPVTPSCITASTPGTAAKAWTRATSGAITITWKRWSASGKTGICTGKTGTEVIYG